MGHVQQELLELDPVAAAALLSAGEAVLVDVREEEEFAAERVPGAQLRPMSDFDVDGWYGFAGRRVILICLGGVRSAAIGRKLLQAGLPAAHVRGGLNAWKEAGLPTQS